MMQPDAVNHQRPLECKGAAEREGNEIVAPKIADVVHFLIDNTVPVNPVGRHIGADIDVRTQRMHHRACPV